MPTPRDLTVHALQTRVWADVAFGVVLGLAALLAQLMHAHESFHGPLELVLLSAAVGFVAHALVLKIGLDLTPPDQD